MRPYMSLLRAAGSSCLCDLFTMKQVSFDPDKHSRFTTLSGDHNPIHWDAVRARRTQPGAPIVHGIHSLLYTLEQITDLQPDLPKVTRIKARFVKPVYVGDVGRVEVVRPSEQRLQAKLLIDATEVTVVSVRFEDPIAAGTPAFITGDYERVILPSVPDNPELQQINGRTGSLPFSSAVEQTAAMFPNVARCIGTPPLAALVSSSSLVGMLIPGLHSLFCGLDLWLMSDLISPKNTLRFQVTSVDSRFRLVRIAIQGGGLHGTLETVSRPPPVEQPSMACVTQRVVQGEFRESTALVVGGSRGLGELTAKLIAAGGGRTIITYATGKADANLVAGSVRATGARCEAIAYDARRGAAEQLAAIKAFPPTQLYYFATPPILRRKAGICDPQRLAEFNSFYIAGFLDLLQTCLHLRPAGISVFYPSTTFIQQRPENMTEYAMSKAAAEILCTDVSAYLPGVRILVRRLPPLQTDQTNSAIPQDTADSMDILLSIVREMHAVGS